jgi:hypothetical protein
LFFDILAFETANARYITFPRTRGDRPRYDLAAVFALQTSPPLGDKPDTPRISAA